MNLNWNEYFMSLAVMASLRSKDPNTKVGAVIEKDFKVIGTGYNGFPSGCIESELTWERDVKKGINNTKYPYVVHSELNAILNTVADTKGASMYTTLFPCNECAKAIIQAGINEVIYLENTYEELPAFKASAHLLTISKVSTRQLYPSDDAVKLIRDAFRKLHSAYSGDYSEK